jgi:YesN/AraC family two-component response regulator
MRILIVDDEEHLRAKLREVIDSSRHNVVEAADGREALAVLTSTRIDLVITDVVMPDMDGLELMRRMRREHPGVKTIVLSASDYSQDDVFLKIARLMGAAGAFKKSISTAELSAVVESIVRRMEAIEKSGPRREEHAPKLGARSKNHGDKKAGKAQARVRSAERVRKPPRKRSGKAPVKTYRNPVAEAAMEQARRRAAA